MWWTENLTMPCIHFILLYVRPVCVVNTCHKHVQIWRDAQSSPITGFSPFSSIYGCGSLINSSLPRTRIWERKKSVGTLSKKSNKSTSLWTPTFVHIIEYVTVYFHRPSFRWIWIQRVLPYSASYSKCRQHTRGGYTSIVYQSTSNGSQHVW